jgi:hypothetical protein
MTTSEIMRGRFKGRLRDDYNLAPGNATRVALDRIRRGKNYPLSLQIAKKNDQPSIDE